MRSSDQRAGSGKRRVHPLIALVAAASLAACGGGGGNAPAAAPAEVSTEPSSFTEPLPEGTAVQLDAEFEGGPAWVIQVIDVNWDAGPDPDGTTDPGKTNAIVTYSVTRLADTEALAYMSLFWYLLGPDGQTYWEGPSSMSDNPLSAAPALKKNQTVTGDIVWMVPEGTTGAVSNVSNLETDAYVIVGDWAGGGAPVVTEPTETEAEPEPEPTTEAAEPTQAAPAPGAGDGSSLTAPLAAGTPFDILESDSSMAWRIEVTGVDWNASDPSWTESSAGAHAVVDLTVTRTGPDPADPYMTIWFYMYGTDGEPFAESMNIAPNDLVGVGDVAQGESASGQIMFEVPAGTSQGILTFETMTGSPVYIATP